MLVGADVKSIEASYPHREPPYSPYHRPGHLSWLNSGIYMLEDVDLEVLAADCDKERSQSVAQTGQPSEIEESCYIFTLIIQTIPVRGSGGSVVSPTVIR